VLRYWLCVWSRDHNFHTTANEYHINLWITNLIVKSIGYIINIKIIWYRKISVLHWNMVMCVLSNFYKPILLYMYTYTLCIRYITLYIHAHTCKHKRAHKHVHTHIHTFIHVYIIILNITHNSTNHNRKTQHKLGLHYFTTLKHWWVIQLFTR
jgi:hypothetical protein